MINPDEETTAGLSVDEPTLRHSSASSSVLEQSARTDIVREDESEVPIEQLGQWHLVWIRFRRHKVAMIGAAIFLCIVALAVIGPYISPETYYNYNYLAINLPPQWDWRYLMGSDAFGHSVLMYILLGARASLVIGIAAALFSSILGIMMGSVAGYYGGWIDSVVMRITDVFLTIPFLPLLILLSYYLSGGNVIFIIFIFAVTGWPGAARLIRSYYLTFREQEFAHAARAVGVSDARVIFRHLLPNALSPIIVTFTLNVAAYITLEAAIDFLGVGLKPPAISWGVALANAQNYLIQGNWWWALFPGVFLVITVLSVNFLGDGLRDALDVRAKTSE